MENKLKTKCLLITGMPGGGKTVTTVALLEEFALQHKKFEFFKFNAMNYSSQKSFMNDMYFKIFKSTSKNPSEELLTKLQQSKRSTHLSIFIDEFDNLFHGNSQDIFALFNVISHPQANISIIGVSNSMEMVFELSKKYKIILPDMKNIVFQPYSQKEIYSIMQSRLKEMSTKLNVPETIIDDKALRLCSGKMYNLKGGDIRCLFDVCKKALETTKTKESISSESTLTSDQDNSYPSVSLPQLNQIIDKLYKVSYKFIGEMPTEQQLIILSIYQILKQKDGIVDINLSQIKQSFDKVCFGMGISTSEVNKIQEILENLSSYQILIIRNKDNIQTTGPKKQAPLKQADKISIFLKITTDDIYDALGENEKFSDFFSQFDNNNNN